PRTLAGVRGNDGETSGAMLHRRDGMLLLGQVGRGALALSLLPPLAVGCFARPEQPSSRPFPRVSVVPAGEIRTAVEWFTLSPDGREIAVLVPGAPGRWRVQLRRLADWRVRRTLSGARLAKRVIFSPDGSRLAVARTHSNTAPKDDFIAV